MNTYLKVVAATGVAVAAAAGLYATAPSSTSIVADAPLTSQGMVAVIDQETGELRAPTNAEAAAYRTEQRRDEKPPTLIRRADGSESMKLDARYETFTTVHRLEDGSWVQRCSMNHDHAVHAQRAVK